MADNFERDFEDDLDAMLELEEEIGVGDTFSPFATKSKKSLNFTTPTSQHNGPKTKPDLRCSILNDSFQNIVPIDSPLPERRQSIKRRQEEMFGALSDDGDQENDIDESLPDIVHKSKRAKTTELQQSQKEKAVPVEDFEITPPPSPSVVDRVACGVLAARRRQICTDQETTEVYRDRITANYNLERPRVHRLRPRDRDFVNVTNPEGIRVYMTVKDDVTQSKEIEALSSGRHQLQLLGTPIYTLKAQVEEKKNKSITESLDKLGDFVDRADELEYVSTEMVEDNAPSKPSLWVDRYSPQRYTELLSDEATNRLVLKWLKQWDYVVFGKECKVPRGDHKDQTKEPKKEFNKDFKGKPFKKNAPEVTDELDEHKRPMQKVTLLSGPPGLGKTTLAHVIARHAGYNVVEINASDDRSAEIFKTKIEAATQMKAVMGADPRPNCLIIDEIDGAPQPAINALIAIIKGPESGGGKKKKKKGNLLLRPIICICNDLYALSLRQLRPLALTVTFPPTIPTKLASRLQQISRTENLRADLTALLALCEKADNDIRSCLNTLQFVRSKGRELSLSSVTSMNVGQKDQHKSLFTVWQRIFTMPKPAKKRYVNPHDREGVPLKQLEDMSAAMNQNNLSYSARFQNTLSLAQATGETEKVMQGIFENYLLSKVKDPRMDKVRLANTWLCTVDVINHEVMSSQNYTLMRYTQYMPVAFHLMFASNQQPKVLYPHSNMENHTKLNKAKGLVEAMVNDMAPSVKKNMNQSVAVMELLPPLLDIIQPNLRPVNTQLYSKREKAELSQLIRIMIAYNMSYQQERTMDGQYVYNLDPCVDEVARLPGVKQHKQLSYAAKQLISREIELEKMRRTEPREQSQPAPVEKQTNKEKQQPGDQPLPNHMRQKLQPKAIAPTHEEHVVDFFGRKVKVDCERPGGTKKADALKEVIGGDVWFRFKEGFTNAVRRTVRLSDLV